MTSDHNDKASFPEGALLVILAEINHQMMAIRDNLASSPAVVAATRGCDIRRYQGSMREEAVHNFESYVEAKTDTGEIFCWSLYITLMPHGWKFERNVARQTSDGEQQEKDFEDFTCDSLSELADHYMALMADFYQSTSNFDFSSR
jgi:hypothetical protein